MSGYTVLSRWSRDVRELGEYRMKSRLSGYSLDAFHVIPGRASDRRQRNNPVDQFLGSQIDEQAIKAEEIGAYCRDSNVSDDESPRKISSQPEIQPERDVSIG